ncbi:MAG: response regulator transcription factor [Clostridia bacterium]|nr:response regulator transcription factor [Deltaproteobacteria bacterium]
MQSDLTQPLVIIAEDDVDARHMMTKYLKALEVRVVEVDDGAPALAAVQAELPALIVLDVNLPSMSGFEICEKLRRKTATARIPVLIVTARDSLEDHARAREVGVNKFMTKPVRKKEFTEAVRALLGR